MGISTLLDIFISRRCYAEKKAQMLRGKICVTSALFFLRNICVKHLRSYVLRFQIYFLGSILRAFSTISMDILKRLAMAALSILGSF